MQKETWAKLGGKPPASDTEALATLAKFTDDPTAAEVYRAYRQVAPKATPSGALLSVVRMVTGDYPEGY